MKNTLRFLPLALALAATTAIAQPVEPASTPQTDGAAARAAELAADQDVDRRCLEETGSRVTADPQPATAKDNTERDGHDCAIGPGTVYTREDIDGTGATNVEDALRALDPRLN